MTNFTPLQRSQYACISTRHPVYREAPLEVLIKQRYEFWIKLAEDLGKSLCKLVDVLCHQDCARLLEQVNLADGPAAFFTPNTNISAFLAIILAIWVCTRFLFSFYFDSHSHERLHFLLFRVGKD